MELHLNQAILFKNTKKFRGSTQPDWIGTINVDNEVRRLVMWFRKAESNGSFFLLGNNEQQEMTIDERIKLIKRLERRIEMLKKGVEKEQKDIKPLESHEYKQQKKGKPKF